MKRTSRDGQQFLHKSLNIKTKRHMTLEIQVMAWDRHQNLAGLNQFMVICYLFKPPIKTTSNRFFFTDLLVLNVNFHNITAV